MQCHSSLPTLRPRQAFVSPAAAVSNPHVFSQGGTASTCSSPCGLSCVSSAVWPCRSRLCAGRAAIPAQHGHDRNAPRTTSTATVASVGTLASVAPVSLQPHGPSKRVLILHTGGTLGMSPEQSFEDSGDLVPGSGGVYPPALQPGPLLDELLATVPELTLLGAELDLRVAFNCDSCRLTPNDWATIAKHVHAARDHFHSFVVITGTDTMSFVASALSFMLAGLNKPVIVTGSQRPLSMPRTDARQNLVDSVSVAVAGARVLREVCVCFGGLLLRGNRAQKTHASAYRAFSSPTYPELARLGVDVRFHTDLLLPPAVYRPRFTLNPHVMRVPVVPGLDPRQAYGSLAERGIKGVVLEVFGVGNCDDRESAGWIPWLERMRAQGVEFFLTSQCGQGTLSPQSYRSGSAAMMLGAESSSLMTPEAATVKLMLVLEHPSLSLKESIAGEV